MAHHDSAFVSDLNVNEEDSPLLSRRFSVNDPAPSNFQEDLDADHGDFGVSDSRNALERSLLRKLDARMSILVLIYILNYIDRNNASAARLRGFEQDLNLEGSQFASILSILYVGYIIMQIPSNMFLNYIGKPSVYLPACMVLWGFISILTGAATNFFGALCTRFFLGFVEAAFFPGALFLISKWYKRDELSQRTAYLTSGSLLASGTGSLIASGILGAMDNVLGLAAWRWLFFVEGGLTVFVAICAIFILPDFPETSHGWLTPAEKALALRRMEEDSPKVLVLDSAENSQVSGLFMAMTDWKVWWLAATLTAVTVSLSFNAYFPTLMATIGYSPTITLLLCAPPWFLATIIAIALSRHSDRAAERCGHITLSMCGGIIGFALAMLTMNPFIRYISLFFMAQSYAGHVCLLAWASGTVGRPPAKRAVALALINTVSSFGNIFGSYAWPTRWEPSYSKSCALCIFASASSIVMCWAFRRQLVALNDHTAKRERQNGEGVGHRYLL